MWDDGPLADGLVELFGSKLRGVQYGGYVSNDKWHIFSSDLRAVDSGGLQLDGNGGDGASWWSRGGDGVGESPARGERAAQQDYYVNGLTVSVTRLGHGQRHWFDVAREDDPTSVAVVHRIMAGAVHARRAPRTYRNGGSSTRTQRQL
jgi:hypothetical protein